LSSGVCSFDFANSITVERKIEMFVEKSIFSKNRNHKIIPPTK